MNTWSPARYVGEHTKNRFKRLPNTTDVNEARSVAVVFGGFQTPNKVLLKKGLESLGTTVQELALGYCSTLARRHRPPPSVRD